MNNNQQEILIYEECTDCGRKVQMRGRKGDCPICSTENPKINHWCKGKRASLLLDNNGKIIRMGRVHECGGFCGLYKKGDLPDESCRCDDCRYLPLSEFGVIPEDELRGVLSKKTVVEIMSQRESNLKEAIEIIGEFLAAWGLEQQVNKTTIDKADGFMTKMEPSTATERLPN